MTNSYNKRSDFASTILILGAKAQIFHQHHLFHKQTLIFSILTTKKLLKIDISKFKYYLSLNIQLLSCNSGHQIYYPSSRYGNS